MGGETKTDELKGAKILVALDDQETLDSIEGMLNELGYECDVANSGADALKKAADCHYELFISDLGMVGNDGAMLISGLKETDRFTPAVTVTSSMDLDIVIDSLRTGILDYIETPIEINRLSKTVSRAIRHGRDERKVEEGGEDEDSDDGMGLSETQSFIASSLAFVDSIESRSKFFTNHSKRTAELCMRVCQLMGMPLKEKSDVYSAAILHDLGNFEVNEKVIDKADKLTDEEIKLIHGHAKASAGISKELHGNDNVIDIIANHHEWFDGSGYPDQVAGDNIPIGARILSVVDAYVAMTSARPFRSALGHEEAVKELRELSGKQFDGKVVEAFIRILTPND